MYLQTIFSFDSVGTIFTLKCYLFKTGGFLDFRNFTFLFLNRLFLSIPVYSSPFQYIPVCYIKFQSILTYSSLFQHILAQSSLCHPIPAYIQIHNPQSPISSLQCPTVHFIPNCIFCLLVLYWLCQGLLYKHCHY